MSRFERWVVDPAPPSLVVLDSWGEDEDGSFGDPLVAIRVRAEPADLARLLAAVGVPPSKTTPRTPKLPAGLTLPPSAPAS